MNAESTMNAHLMMVVAVILLSRAAKDRTEYGRKLRLVGQTLFALGRAGLDNNIDQEVAKKWLEVTGNDFEADKLRQINLRETILHFKFTQYNAFASVFKTTAATAILYKAAASFDVMSNRAGADGRVVAESLSLTLLALAEARYKVETRNFGDGMARQHCLRQINQTAAQMLDGLCLTDDLLQAKTAVMIQNPQTAAEDSYLRGVLAK